MQKCFGGFKISSSILSLGKKYKFLKSENKTLQLFKVKRVTTKTKKAKE